MAYFGLSNPWIAELNTETGKYSNAIKCGSAMSTSVTPNYIEGTLSADNVQKENVKEFKDATVALGVDRIPAAAGTMLFGHTEDTDGSEVSKSDDQGKYVGYAFITKEVEDGVIKHRACLLTKVKFSEQEESYETKGDSIVIKGGNLSGTAVPDANKDWRKKSPKYDTEEEADAWIQKTLIPQGKE